MIDRTQLTEALNKTGIAEFVVNEDTEPHHVRLVRDAAKWARDFPTDEQVEAAAQQIWVFSPSTMTRTKDQWTIISDRRRDRFRQMARSALEAVTMIGEEK